MPNEFITAREASKRMTAPLLKYIDVIMDDFTHSGKAYKLYPNPFGSDLIPFGVGDVPKDIGCWKVSK